MKDGFKSLPVIPAPRRGLCPEGRGDDDIVNRINKHLFKKNV